MVLFGGEGWMVFYLFRGWFCGFLVCVVMVSGVWCLESCLASVWGLGFIFWLSCFFYVWLVCFGWLVVRLFLRKFFVFIVSGGLV